MNLHPVLLNSEGLTGVKASGIKVQPAYERLLQPTDT